jgi:hypothetical protein
MMNFHELPHKTSSLHILKLVRVHFVGLHQYDNPDPKGSSGFIESQVTSVLWLRTACIGEGNPYGNLPPGRA